MADSLAASSPVSGQHLNLPGEFDFSDEALNAPLRFEVEAPFAFQWEFQPARSFNFYTNLLTKAN